MLVKKAKTFLKNLSNNEEHVIKLRYIFRLSTMQPLKQWL